MHATGGSCRSRCGVVLIAIKINIFTLRNNTTIGLLRIVYIQAQSSKFRVYRHGLLFLLLFFFLSDHYNTLILIIKRLIYYALCTRNNNVYTPAIMNTQP